jgi:hypothetical protein
MKVEEFKNIISKEKKKHNSLIIKITKKKLENIIPKYFEYIKKNIADGIVHKEEVENEKWNCLYLEIDPQYQDIFFYLSTEDIKNDGSFMFRKKFNEVSEEELEILSNLFSNDKFYYKPKK